MVWPSFAFGAAAFAYAGFGGGLHRKRAGWLTWLTRILFAPLLLCQWLSWHYYRGKSPRWSKITPRVWMAALLTDAEAKAAIAQGVTAVLDLTVEFSETDSFRSLHYEHLPVLDLTAPIPDQLAYAAAFVERESALGIVLVDCKAGYSRSAAAVGPWLITTGRARNVQEVVTRLEAARPGIVIRPEVREALGEIRTPARFAALSTSGARP